MSNRTEIATRLADFVAAQSGAMLDRAHPPIVFNDEIVVCGAVAEMAKVQGWAHSLGISCSVDPTDDDPDFEDWTCARISLASAARALAAAQRAVTAAGELGRAGRQARAAATRAAIKTYPAFDREGNPIRVTVPE